MDLNQIKRIGIVGAGLMGHGIAQVFARAGYEVLLTDTNKTVLSESLSNIEDNLKELLDLQMIEAHKIPICLDRISLVDDPEPSFQSCQVVFEAINEDLEIKKALFSRLEKFCATEAVFCSNTSSIPIGLISEGLAHAQRVLGTHFWNPSNVMPCVEVIRSDRTDDQVFEVIVALMKRIGKKPVKVLKDVPGFLGNRLQLALLREALFVVEEGIASPEDIDAVVKNGFGMRLPFAGPFELMDATGHDVGCRVQDFLFPALSCGKSAPKTMQRMVARGELGVKTGKGFFDWPEQKADRRRRFRNTGLFTLIELLERLEEKTS